MPDGEPEQLSDQTVLIGKFTWSDFKNEFGIMDKPEAYKQFSKY